MSDLAAMHAQLVDVRNVGPDMKLTLHIDVAFAEQVIQTFGWPTRADPIPVALARLNEAPGV